jgi:beta-1,2-mannobiose phosphorylase / 1,2-beta-oligomannan phosphorylase
MLKVKKEGIILEKTAHAFENDGVFNPAAIREGDFVHVFYRAVHKGNYSTIGYAKLKGPLKVVERHDKPLIFPTTSYESQGVEDPRIVKIDGLFYLTYTAYDKVNAMGAVAVSHDLVEFDKRGRITPEITYDQFQFLAQCSGQINEKYLQHFEFYRLSAGHGTDVLLWDKNVMFFPRRVNGKLMFLHRVRPGIQIAAVDELSDIGPKFWEHYCLEFSKHVLMDPKYPHEASFIGGGCPPIETEEGWLLIYHGVQDSPNGYIYSACAALLDLDNPYKEIARLKTALFSPTLKWEKEGYVKNVCFPTGAALFGDILYIYYGAADERIAVASVKLSALLSELKNNGG